MTTQYSIRPDEAALADDEEARLHLVRDHGWRPTVYPSPPVVEAVHDALHQPRSRSQARRVAVQEDSRWPEG